MSPPAVKGLDVFVADSDPCLCSTISDALRAAGFGVAVVGSRVDALQQLSIAPALPRLLIASTRLEHLASDVRARFPALPMITLTERTQPGSAKKSTDAGAVASLAREPLDLLALEAAVKHALNPEPHAPDPVPVASGRVSLGNLGMVGESAPMRAVYELVRRAARFDSQVLILGETGTGKDLVARAIHDLSHRAKARLVSVNCAAMPEELLESELFGHMRGAFTGAYDTKLGLLVYATGGTMFLDEITAMPLHLQSKLLRVLQDKKVRPVGGTESRDVDVRIVAAANEDVAVCLKERRFRPDLFYRLNVFPIEMPALRDRPGDVALLVKYFVAQKSVEYGREKEPVISADAVRALVAYKWPGNVRELESAIERALQLCDGPAIGLEHLPRAVLRGAPNGARLLSRNG